MAADRVPASGEVWVLRHLRAFGRGRVTILAVDVPADVVRYRFQGTGGEHETTLTAFVSVYDWLAVDEQTAVTEHGPQVQHGVRRLVDMPIRLGTAVD